MNREALCGASNLGKIENSRGFGERQDNRKKEVLGGV